MVRVAESIEVDPEPLGASASALAGGTAHVLQERTGPGELAGAVLYAHRHGVDRLVIYADEDAGSAARLASLMDPGFELNVRATHGADSSPAEAEPMPVVMPGPDGAQALLDQLRRAGLDVVLERGEWRGELLGLEVARVVRWPAETGGDDALHIEAGVGRFDRDAAAVMHQGESPAQGLERSVRMVSQHRYQGAPTHPLTLLARSRWMRSVAQGDPSLVGASELGPVESTFPADSVREERPAVAVGRTDGGEPLVVAFGVGAGFELVPVAADTRELHLPGARLRIAVPPWDRMGVLDVLVSACGAAGRGPTEVYGMDTPWET